MMQKRPRPSVSTAATDSIASPALIVALVLLIGATIYLWRQRYLRRNTAFTILAILGVAFIAAAYATYQNSL